MPSYISEFNVPKFAEYYLTSYGADYDNVDAEPLPISLGLLFPDLVPSPDEEGEIYHTRTFEQPFEGEQLPNYDGSGNWLGPCESFFDGCLGENQFFHGYGVDVFNNSYDSGLEKTEDPYLVEEHRAGFDSYDDNVEMQPAYDSHPWSWAELVEDWCARGTEGVETAYSYSWDDMKICESIFGHWPCLLKDNPETYGELLA